MRPPNRVGVVISWVDTHGRSVALAEALGLESVFMPWARPRLPMVRTLTGWARSAVRTVAACRRLPSGSLLVVQVPPVFAGLAATLAGRRHVVVLDLHSGALNDPRWSWSHGLLTWSMRRSAAVIVTTRALVEGTQMGVTTVIELHDPMIDRRGDTAPALAPAGALPYVVFPAGGAADEPLDAVIEAAALLDGTIDIRITGRIAERLSGTRATATGFLPEDEYLRLLAGSSGVLALTTREATMQRAAYEALELGLPIVASGTSALRRALGDAAVFVASDGTSIADGIRTALARSDGLRAAGNVLFDELRTASSEVLDQLRSLPAPTRSARP